jgi:hypothetical protein
LKATITNTPTKFVSINIQNYLSSNICSVQNLRVSRIYLFERALRNQMMRVSHNDPTFPGSQ